MKCEICSEYCDRLHKIEWYLLCHSCFVTVTPSEDIYKQINPAYFRRLSDAKAAIISHVPKEEIVQEHGHVVYDEALNSCLHPFNQKKAIADLKQAFDNTATSNTQLEHSNRVVQNSISECDKKIEIKRTVLA